jgi:hypothetical protein
VCRAEVGVVPPAELGQRNTCCSCTAPQSEPARTEASPFSRVKFEPMEEVCQPSATLWSEIT